MRHYLLIIEYLSEISLLGLRGNRENRVHRHHDSCVTLASYFHTDFGDSSVSLNMTQPIGGLTSVSNCSIFRFGGSLATGLIGSSSRRAPEPSKYNNLTNCRREIAVSYTGVYCTVSERPEAQPHPLYYSFLLRPCIKADIILTTIFAYEETKSLPISTTNFFPVFVSIGYVTNY